MVDADSLSRAIRDMLVKTGGRPKVAGTNTREVIPMTFQDALILERIAGELREEGLAVTSNQVAAVLLRLAMNELTRNVFLLKKGNRDEDQAD